MKSKKKTKNKTIKRKLWNLYSKVRRKEDAIKRGDGERVPCVTCGKQDHWKNMHAGHYIHGKTKETWITDENIHNQCPTCNTYKGGQLDEYYIFIVSEYGQEKADYLRSKRAGLKLWKTPEMELIYQDLAQRADSLGIEL